MKSFLRPPLFRQARPGASWAGCCLGLGMLWLTGTEGIQASEGINDTNAASTHWSFQKVTRPPVPTVKRIEWVRNPIDAFVLARLEREGIEPSPEADAATLARRLSLDLIGLPPEAEAQPGWNIQSGDAAYGRSVDRLLDSPHFGEQWGRHWLDLARYADSDGYEKDSIRPWAWPYRDWVIRSLNRDMPFDQFTIEQLAGDLLLESDQDQKVATGFHRNTLTNKEGGVDAEEFRCKAVVDRVGTTATVWLGLTMGCAECHNHKYDPLTQREFYELYAFFNEADEEDLPVPSAEDRGVYERAMAGWERERERLETARRNFEPGVAALDHVADYYREVYPGLRRVLAPLEAHAKRRPSFPGPKAQTLTRAASARATHVHVRGDFLRKGELASPGTPAVLHPFRARGPVPDRLDLARWLMDPANPLTARATVNHVWRQLFGRGLVTTPEDFGTRGDRPVHPELLDWLATEWVRLGWSRKALIRLMVSSNTYRQASHHRPDLETRDPMNTLWARQNRFRLTAENVRDVCLATSGLLISKLGGPGVRPPLPADIAALGYANSVKWEESVGADRYRRGLYIVIQRTVPYPMLTAFDAPDSSVTCTRRERSNTPLQALTLLNDPVFFECAQALARRVRDEAPSAPNELQLRRAFECAVSRSPTDSEQKRLLKLFDDQLQRVRAQPRTAERIAGHGDVSPGELDEHAARVAVCRVLLNLDEFMTRE